MTVNIIVNYTIITNVHVHVLSLKLKHQYIALYNEATTILYIHHKHVHSLNTT